MNYTKGEWIIEQDCSDDRKYYILTELNAGYSYTLADIRPCPHGDSFANANLIASSPMMYEALKDLLAQYKKGNIEIDYKSRELINKALAKAEGREK